MQISHHNVYVVLFLRVVLFYGALRTGFYMQRSEQLAFIFSPLIHRGEEAGRGTAPAELKLQKINIPVSAGI